VGHQLLLVPSVTAFARRSDGGILIVRLREEDHWTLPGGLVELGEAPVDALVREAREEAGVEIEPVSVLGVFGGPDGFRRTYLNGDEIECLEILFKCRVVGTTVNPEDSEVSECGFQMPHQIQHWAYPIPVASLCDAADDNRTLATIDGRALLL